jgi:hypothetical protein
VALINLEWGGALSAALGGFNVVKGENMMVIVGDASKSRLIAVFLDHFIALALMLFIVALVPERLPVIKAVFFFLIYLKVAHKTSGEQRPRGFCHIGRYEPTYTPTP